jgi:hypothetical protein
MPWTHPGTGEEYPTIPEQIEGLRNSGCGNAITSIFGIFILFAVGYATIPKYWDWASSFAITSYPNLNGTVITLAILIGIIVLWRVGIIPLALQIIAGLAKILLVLLQVLMVIGLIGGGIYLIYIWLFSK